MSDDRDADAVIDMIEKTGLDTELIGTVTNTERIIALYKKKRIVLN
ncbi:hypothetical protein GWN63_05690 [Candidatus Bathyarchaeota archaeon]|nr:hypothetical protein [Candidatus Bathyarchaeota archaeon]NIR13780.1 hypothetical protein [Desulfobacterales bacterium]NIU81715.1 hypothetical protein [Candidatus Bathyarchaeota archaeon]NIV68363.1 hypothetical protein [Candidatus Bathyarchaeota archaeon]